MLNASRRVGRGLGGVGAAVWALTACLGVLCAAGCGNAGGGAAAPSLKPQLDKCEADAAKLRQQVLDLKKKLAITLARPGTIRIDPNELAIDGKLPAAPAPREGTISQAEILRTIRAGMPALQACYTRALKRDTSLHHGTLKITLAFTVKPNGKATRVIIRPNRSAVLADCMAKSVKRWRFPTFKGQAVEVEAPVKLTPKQ